MNLLGCKPETGADGALGLRMQGNNELLKLPAFLQQLVKEKAERDHNLVLGVRPEDTTVHTADQEHSLPAEVYVTEKMGSYKIVDLSYGEEIVRARTSTYVEMDMGQNVRRSFDMDRVRLFDAESGQSVMN